MYIPNLEMSFNSQGFEFHLQLAKKNVTFKKRHCEKSKILLPELLKNVITVLLKDLEPPQTTFYVVMRNREEGTQDQRRTGSLKLSAN